MDNNRKFKQDDIVSYRLPNGIVGHGKVVGVATIGEAVIGRSIIIEDLSGNFPNNIYPFTHFVLFEGIDLVF